MNPCLGGRLIALHPARKHKVENNPMHSNYEVVFIAVSDPLEIWSTVPGRSWGSTARQQVKTPIFEDWLPRPA